MFKEKFAALSSREQTILLFAAPLIIVLILWLALIKPVISTDTKLNKSILTKQQQLSWMQKNAALVGSTSSLNSNNQATPQDKSKLRQLMNQLIQAQQISIERIQNVNNEDVSYRFDNSQFNDILQLVKACEEKGIKVVQLQITKSKTVGRVNTRLTVGVNI